MIKVEKSWIAYFKKDLKNPIELNGQALFQTKGDLIELLNCEYDSYDEDKFVIKRVNEYSVYCDKCKELFVEDITGFSFWSSKEDLMEMLSYDYNWKLDSNDKVLCQICS